MLRESMYRQVVRSLAIWVLRPELIESQTTHKQRTWFGLGVNVSYGVIYFVSFTGNAYVKE